jgi:tRNA(Arg) A34 adenosine deaminase TadA
MTSSKAVTCLENLCKYSLRAHPLYTPTMLCVEGVAAIIRGDIPELLDLLPSNPYLCSGFDLYITTEPDLMSSMALVHSRIRRVFFLNTDTGSGALTSKANLHELRALNHKFRVFQVLS